MTGAQRRYLVIEAATGAAINGVLSLVFALLVFGGEARIATARLVVDAAPQTFMVVLMSAVVPTLLTRRRVAAGAVAPAPPMRLALPRPALVRGLIVAIGATIVSVGIHHLAVSHIVGQVTDFWDLLVFKIGYGALLGALVSSLAVRLALGEAGGRTGER